MTNAMNTPSFSLTIEEVFYIKPPIDRVILVGTIQSGSVRVGDSLLVQCTGIGDVLVTLDGIETLDRGPVENAQKGQQVGLKVAGISKEQPMSGDRVVKKKAE